MQVGDLVRYKYDVREIGVIIATAARPDRLWPIQTKGNSTLHVQCRMITAEPTNQLPRQHKVFWCALPDDEPPDYRHAEWMREVGLEVLSEGR